MSTSKREMKTMLTLLQQLTPHSSEAVVARDILSGYGTPAHAYVVRVLI